MSTLILALSQLLCFVFFIAQVYYAIVLSTWIYMLQYSNAISNYFWVSLLVDFHLELHIE